MSEATTPYWWARDDLEYTDGKLMFAGREVEQLARQHGTPAFFYSGKRVLANAQRLHDALNATRLQGRFRILYAMKANRFAPLLTWLKGSGLLGIDACSPNEVEHAIACGFESHEISFTNTSLSRQDLERLNRIDGLAMNCDSIHAIRKWGELGSGREIGIRINPAIGLGRAGNDKLQYSGADATKFGIYREQFPEAMAAAREYGLTISKIHFHTGCGYLTPQLDCWDGIIQSCMWFVEQLDSVRIVNVGGGLGVPHVASDKALDLQQWAAVLERNFAQRDVTIEVEPGDYLVKDSGILCLTLNAVEQKADKIFAGVNAGFNIALEPAVYGLPFEPVLAEQRIGETQTVTIAGNINEALDLFYKDIEMPVLEEEDTLVLINAGAYSSSMASNHCMRGEFKEFLLL